MFLKIAFNFFKGILSILLIFDTFYFVDTRKSRGLYAVALLDV